MPDAVYAVLHEVGGCSHRRTDAAHHLMQTRSQTQRECAPANALVGCGGVVLVSLPTCALVSQVSSL